MPTTASDSASPTAAGRTILRWDVEDADFWAGDGRRVARRNLAISVPCLLLAFSVWSIWSMLITKLPQVGFAFSESQLFWLAALPGLSGATLRIFYSFLVPIFGGRNWTAVSTASLLIPTLGIAWAVRNPSTPYSVFVVLSLLSGLGGGNFASSMANISFFYPKKVKGAALGLNAGLGNLGVSIAQLVVPLVIVTGGLAFAFGDGRPVIAKAGIESVGQQLYLQNAALIWTPFIVLAAIAAWFGMNNLSTARASFREQSIIFRRKHNWVMCWLYIGTFGSFIGYSAALPMLIKTQFFGVNPMLAFFGPLVGALVRPIGGWLADQVGGARVTLWNFVVMGLALLGVLYFLNQQQFGGFFAMFLLLFATTGIGNGSTFRMIPVIFLNQHTRGVNEPAARAAAVARAGKEAAAVVGFSSALAAYGMFLIPKLFGWSKAAHGSLQPALYGFLGFYVTCVVVTWWFYARRGAEAPC